MIKSIRFLEIFTTIIVALMITSCVQDDDFSVPDNLGAEENKGLQTLLESGALEIPMAELKIKYANNYKKPVLIDTISILKATSALPTRKVIFLKSYFFKTPQNIQRRALRSFSIRSIPITNIMWDVKFISN